jgi:hypothetical protein
MSDDQLNRVCEVLGEVVAGRSAGLELSNVR